MQQPVTVPPAKNPDPPKKRRRKLNTTIFDVDTAAALRTKAQAEPSIVVETKNPPRPEISVQQEATGTVIPRDPLVKGPPERIPVEHLPDVGDATEEQSHTRSKNVSRRDRCNAVPKLVRTGVQQNEPSPKVTAAGSSRIPMEDLQPLEVCITIFVAHIKSDLSLIGSDSRTTT